MTLSIIGAFLITGVCSGTLAGLLGIGGGLILVPAIMAILHLQGVADENTLKIGVATSLAVIIPTAISSARAHHRSGALRWDIFKKIVFGIIFGSFIGAILVDYLPERILYIIFGTGCILVGLKIITGANAPKSSRTLPSTGGLSFAGMVIGTLSSMLGIGGGTLIVPFLSWCNINIRSAVATSSACGLPTALAGALTFWLAGSDNQAQLPDHSLGYIYLPAFFGISITAILFAPLGAKLTTQLPVERIKQCLAVVFLIAGAKMLLH